MFFFFKTLSALNKSYYHCQYNKTLTREYYRGKYHCTINLLFDWFGINSMTTDNFCFYLQNRLIQTRQTGGQWYSDTSPFSIPCINLLNLLLSGRGLKLKNKNHGFESPTRENKKVWLFVNCCHFYPSLTFMGRLCPLENVWMHNAWLIVRNALAYHWLAGWKVLLGSALVLIFCCHQDWRPDIWPKWHSS